MNPTGYGGRFTAICGVALALLAPASSAAQDTTLYGYDVNRIYEVNQSTAAVTTLWTFSPALPFGAALARRPSDAMLFYLDNTTAATQLWRWDPSSPATAPVLIGTLGITDYLPRLAFHPNGTLYGMDMNGATLYSINTTTGVPSVAATYTTSQGSVGGDIAISTTGIIYMLIRDEIWQVPIGGGAHVFLGSISGPASGTVFTGAAFDANGLFLASSNGGDLFRVDIPSRTSTLIGNSGSTLGDLGTIPVIPPPQADLQVTKVDDLDSLAVGDTLTYTITVTNSALSTGQGTGVQMADSLPPGVTLVSAVPSQGSCFGISTINCSLGTLAIGSSATIVIKVIPGSGGILTNVATASGNENDPVPMNDVATETTSVSDGSVADLSVVKTGPAAAQRFFTVTYLLTMTNNGPATAFNSVLTDSLPAGQQFLSASRGATQVGQLLTWPAVTLGPGQSIVDTVRIRVWGAVGTTFTNVANVTSGMADPDLTNNRSTVATLVTNFGATSADVQVTKTGPATALVADTITYVVTTRNNGTSTADNVIVSDTMPAGVSFISASRSAVRSGQILTWPSTSLANGATLSDTVVVVVTTSGTWTNIAASTSTTTDPDGTNNDGSGGGRVSTIISDAADLSLSKTDGVTQVVQGGSITYAIVVSNAGPSAVTGATVTDVFPAELSGVTWTCSGTGGGSCTASGSGDISESVNLPSGATVTFSATATATGTDTVVNTASVAPPVGVVDPDTTNNSAADNDTEIVVLGVTVTPDGVDSVPRVPSNGTVYSYDFEITNTSDVAEAFDLYASPGGAIVTVDSITGANVTRGARADSAQLASLAIGASDSATVWYTVANAAEGSLDSLELSAVAVTDSGVDDQGWLHVEVVKPNLTFTKSVTPTGTLTPGTDLTYTVTVTNIGSEFAADVTIVDQLPPEVAFKLGSTSTALPPGITAVEEFSLDNGGSWTYTPVSSGCGSPAGYDGCVTDIRWTLQQDLSQVAPNNTGDASFVAMIK